MEIEQLEKLEKEYEALLKEIEENKYPSPNFVRIAYYFYARKVMIDTVFEIIRMLEKSGNPQADKLRKVLVGSLKTILKEQLKWLIPQMKKKMKKKVVFPGKIKAEDIFSTLEKIAKKISLKDMIAFIEKTYNVKIQVVEGEEEKEEKEEIVLEAQGTVQAITLPETNEEKKEVEDEIDRVAKKLQELL